MLVKGTEKMLPLFVFFHGLFQTLRYWNTRLKKFKIIALSKITEGLLSKTLNIGYGFYISNQIMNPVKQVLDLEKDENETKTVLGNVSKLKKL